MSIISQRFEIRKEFVVVLMNLREAQNHKNNKSSVFIRKMNPYLELLILPDEINGFHESYFE